MMPISINKTELSHPPDIGLHDGMWCTKQIVCCTCIWDRGKTALGGEERNEANAINKAGGGGETQQLKNNNQLMIINVTSTSGRGGQWRDGKRR